MSVHLITGGTSLDHLVKVCLLGFFTARLVINDYYGGATFETKEVSHFSSNFHSSF